MKRYILAFAIAALAIVGAAAGANKLVATKTVTKACFGVQTSGTYGNGASKGDVNIYAKGKRVCIVGKKGAKGATGAAGLNGTNGTNGKDGAQGPAGPKGDTGPAGPPGPKGDSGAQGAPGVNNVQADVPYGQDIDPNAGLTQSSDTIAPGTQKTVWVQCHEGQTALGGGFVLGGTGDYYNGGTSEPGVQILSSTPAYVENGALSTNPPITNDQIGSFRPNAWSVSAYNSTDSPVVVRPSIVCASVNP